MVYVNKLAREQLQERRVDVGGDELKLSDIFVFDKVRPEGDAQLSSTRSANSVFVRSGVWANGKSSGDCGLSYNIA